MLPSSPKDSQLSPAIAHKSSLCRQKSDQWWLQVEDGGWGGGVVRVDCKEVQENFWVVSLGLELSSSGYTWVCVFVKTDVYT